MLNLSPAELVQAVLIVVVSLTFHEYGHSLVAISLGDDTPRREGRLTLNPIAHIDFVGFILLVLAGFGWAKPVRIDPRALRKPRRDEILISLAGPAANLVLALVLASLLSLFLHVAEASSGFAAQRLAVGVFNFVTRAVAINVGLAIFNLLPLPPLDGSHVITTWLARFDAALAATFFRYGSFLLLALIVIERITNWDILPVGRWTIGLVLSLYGLVGMG